VGITDGDNMDGTARSTLPALWEATFQTGKGMVFSAGQIKERASIIQSKTQKPVRLEISEST
jgi:hypothetical protein